MHRPRILLADDHPDFLAITVQVVESKFDCEVVKTFDDGQAIVNEAAELDPDLFVLDISMPGLNGIEAALQLRAAGRKGKIVFLTVYEDQDYLRSALAAGALGYVLKTRMATDLVPALRQALVGQQFVSQSMLSEESTLRDPHSMLI